jgi:hypothetical protein
VPKNSATSKAAAAQKPSTNPEQGEIERAALRPEPEKRSRLHMKAVGRTERLGLHQHAVKDHRHGEAQHGEKDFAVAREQETDQESGDAGTRRAREHHQEHVAHRRKAADQRHRIGPDGVEQRLPERHEAGPPQDDEAQHHQGIGERDGGKRHQPGRHHQRHRREGEEGHGAQDGVTDGVTGGVVRPHRQIFRGLAWEIRP